MLLLSRVCISKNRLARQSFKLDVSWFFKDNTYKTIVVNIQEFMALRRECVCVCVERDRGTEFNISV